jgi:hypothetical protein
MLMVLEVQLKMLMMLEELQRVLKMLLMQLKMLQMLEVLQRVLKMLMVLEAVLFKGWGLGWGFISPPP